MRPATLKGRLLRTLRESHLPVPTGDLAALCADGMPHPVQQTNVTLRDLHRAGIVTRHPPAKIGRPGCPAWRWSLRKGGG